MKNLWTFSFVPLLSHPFFSGPISGALMSTPPSNHYDFDTFLLEEKKVARKVKKENCEKLPDEKTRK